MPADKRQYITVPLDYYKHPKVSRLSIEAREGFLILNIEAREAKNDGRFDIADAEFLVGSDVMTELIASHPARPLVARVGEQYAIRDFAQHQLTEAQREEVSASRSERGKKGAAARWGNANPMASDGSLPSATMLSDGKACQESESESESEKPTYVTKTKRKSSSNEHDHGTLIPDNWTPTQQHADKAKSLHLDVNTETRKFKSHAHRTQRRMKNWNAAFTNWLKQGAIYKQQAQGQPPANRPRMSKAAQNAEAYRKEFGADDTQGSLAVPHYRISP